MRTSAPIVGNRAKCIQARVAQSSNCDCRLRNSVRALPRISSGFTALRSDLFSYQNYPLDVLEGRQCLQVVVGLHDQP